MPIRDEALSCVVCERGLIDVNDWSACTAERRADLLAAGYARASRRDLCATCYARLKRSGQLGKYTPKKPPAATDMPTPKCARCGHPFRVLGDLCRDCADVTYDLEEQAKWAGIDVQEMSAVS